MQGRSSCKKGNNSIDSLFIFEEARFTKIKFHRLVTSRLYEISNMFFDTLDTVIPDTDYSLGQANEQFSSRAENESGCGSNVVSVEHQDEKSQPNKELLMKGPYRKSLRSDFEF